MRYQQNVNPVIVNYKTPHLVVPCVRSMLEHGIASPENIIVVDNKSPDDSVAVLQREIPEVRLIASQTNAGFSAGVNCGANFATQEYLLILNPDTYFTDASIEKAIALMEADPAIGIAGLELVYPSGERQFSARRFYSVTDIVGRRLPVLSKMWPLKGRVARHMMEPEWARGEPFDAEWVMGTGFLIRRSLFEQLGRMDEAYFLYMEDVDLCARVWLAGYRVVCVPGARLVHDHQRQSKAGPFSWAGRVHLKSLQTFRQRYRVPLFCPPGVQRILR